MVGRGGVDPDLQPEIVDECSRNYGAVLRCAIYEVRAAILGRKETECDGQNPDVNVPPEHAVLVFVMFEDALSAVRGMTLVIIIALVRI
jgi:hypothetical protein